MLLAKGMEIHNAIALTSIRQCSTFPHYMGTVALQNIIRNIDKNKINFKTDIKDNFKNLTSMLIDNFILSLSYFIITNQLNVS